MNSKLTVALILGALFLFFAFVSAMSWLSVKHEEKMAEMGYIQKMDAGVKLWVKE